jgi:hypothetical protein
MKAEFGGKLFRSSQKECFDKKESEQELRSDSLGARVGKRRLSALLKMERRREGGSSGAGKGAGERRRED